VYEADDVKKYFEVKCNSDGLKMSQVFWLENNPDADVTVLWIASSKKCASTVYLTKAQNDFFENNCINFSKYVSKIIDRAILLKEVSGSEFLKFIDDAIDKIKKEEENAAKK
jgi:hypothetical protein